MKLPIDLQRAINRLPHGTEMWDRLRPSCQVDYAQRVRTAKTPEQRRQKLARVLELTKAYYRRHGPRKRKQ